MLRDGIRKKAFHCVRTTWDIFFKEKTPFFRVSSQVTVETHASRVYFYSFVYEVNVKNIIKIKNL